MRKRLQTIQNILESANYQELQTELDGLNHNFPSSEWYAALVQACESKSYEQALQVVQDALFDYYPPVPIDDITLPGLRTSLALLETRLSVLNHRKLEMHRLINEFRFMHNKILGSLMTEIFEIRKEILFLDLQENENLTQEYEEAENDFHSFREHQKENAVHKVLLIDKSAKAELNALYRKASKLCHPDLISEDLHQEATLLFIRLNEAYLSNDLDGLKDVLHLLENGGIQLANRTETIKEKDRLTAGIMRLQTEIDKLEREISSISESAVYRTISYEEDMDSYFQGLKTKFEKERDHLRASYESRKKPDA